MKLFEKKTDHGEALDFHRLRDEKTQGEEGLAQRKRNEKALEGKKVDGRSLKKTGRTEQFNTKCKPGFRERVIIIAQAENISMAEVIERALEVYEKKLKL